MKIIVYEHVSGGGYAEQVIPPSVLAEGFGMLRSVVADFKDAGHEVTVLLDARIAKLHPQIEVSKILPIHYHKEAEKLLSKNAKINDATYIIAPETAGTLQSLVELAEKTGQISLNCKSSAINIVSNKAVLYESLQSNGFLTPKTLILKSNTSTAKVKQTIKLELNYPVVVKPADGVACIGLSVVKNEAQIEKALAKVKTNSANKYLIIQEFKNGESASVSLLSNGKRARALSLNKQNLTLSDPDSVSSYDGGCVPFEHPLREEAFALAENVVESFSGLQGLVGVDLILAAQRAFVVDVNPRLTTSNIGLYKVAHFNVPEALVNAVLKGTFPTKKENRCVACFTKIETAKLTISVFQKLVKLDAVISPPFPLNNNGRPCALIIGEGDSLDAAKAHLEEAKKHLLNIIS